MAEDKGAPAGGTDGPDRAELASADHRTVPSSAPGKGQGDLHTYIGSRLRQAFDDIASQPVPDRFLQLMQDLDKA